MKQCLILLTYCNILQFSLQFKFIISRSFTKVVVIFSCERYILKAKSRLLLRLLPRRRCGRKQPPLGFWPTAVSFVCEHPRTSSRQSINKCEHGHANPQAVQAFLQVGNCKMALGLSLSARWTSQFYPSAVNAFQVNQLPWRSGYCALSCRTLFVSYARIPFLITCLQNA